ncbi:MAG: hypothetical protein H0U73_05235 [Tatlockia sp.]|nr:hypothetical protein [Tatlockia sp.]
MKAKLTPAQIFWKGFRLTLKVVLTLLSAVLEIASDSKKPVCGPAVARARKARGTISRAKFYKATRHN